jgi:two-component system KDP operon response regulator KdpE
MNSNKYKVLIIEDERNIRHFVKTILMTNGYQIIEAKTAAEGKMAFMSHSPDVVILDLGLPDGDGMDFLKLVRKEFTTPIIVLSARTDEKDKVAALDLGANDYITKPFGTAELQARVRAALRVHQQNMNRSLGGDNNFKMGNLTIDYDTRHVLIKGEDIKLTQTEYNIVALLAAHAGKVMTYSEIIKEIWKWSDAGSVKKLQVNMANIRKKMGVKPGDHQYILNELGVGYRLNVEIDHE